MFSITNEATIGAMSKKAPPSNPPTQTKAQKSQPSAWPKRIRYVSIGIVLLFAGWVGAHASAKPAGPSTLAPALAEAPLPHAEDNGFTFLRNKHFAAVKSEKALAVLADAENTPWPKLDPKAIEMAYEDEKIQEKLSALDEASLKPEFADDCLYDMPNCSTLAIYAAHQLNMLAAVTMTLRNPEGDEGAARIATILRMADRHAATSKSLISEMVAMTSLVRGLRLAVGFGRSGYQGTSLRDVLATLTLRKSDAARVIRQETVWTHNALMVEEKNMPWNRRMLYAGAETAQMYDDGVRAWLRCFEAGEPPPGPLPNPKASALWWTWNPVGKGMLTVLDSMSLAGLKLYETFGDAQKALDEAKKLVH